MLVYSRWDRRKGKVMDNAVVVAKCDQKGFGYSIPTGMTRDCVFALFEVIENVVTIGLRV